MTGPVRIGIIGFGWRAAGYLRVARMLPDRFHVSGICVRDLEKYKPAAAAQGVPLYAGPAELAEACDFLLLAVSKTSIPDILARLISLDKPILTETPPAWDAASLEAVAALPPGRHPVQVAEQYPLQPHHQARRALIRSGSLGDVRHVQVSAAHGYHGISLIRSWLEPGGTCEIVARRFGHPVLEVPYRGKPAGGGIETEVQEIALLSFEDGKSAVFDFTRSQYFSPIRRGRVLIRGSRGEVRDNEVTRIHADGSPETVAIVRIQDGQEGSLAPLSLRELRAGRECLFRNPFHPAPLSDEEIAMAQALERMAAFVRGGEPFYPLSEALADVRLSLAIEEAIRTGAAVRATL